MTSTPNNLNFGSRRRAHKSYELSNHLGNVLAVVSDRRLGRDQILRDDIAESCKAEVISAQDYYPFGMEMEGRDYANNDFNNYRYGFNDD